MIRVCIFITLFQFLNCSLKLQKNAVQRDISIQLLNDKLYLPKEDNISCSDTVYFEISNNSKYEYLFDNSDNLGFTFLANSPLDEDYIDPFNGFGLTFIDSNGNYLHSEGNFGYYPEGFENYKEPENPFHVLEQHEQIIIKVPLVFPSTLDYGNYIQTIPDLESTKKVEIFFRPINGYLKNVLLANGQMELSDNQKIMDVTSRFYLPVEFSCQPAR